MRIATLTRSFSAGEITPELFGRIDLAKYQTGLKTCRNFEVLPHGPVANSPGFEYILETKNSAKQSVLIPFIFNTAQAYQLEFGDQYIRFHTQGGTVLEAGGAITAITQANPGVVTQNAHGYANGQVIFLSGIGGMTQLNGRFVTVAGVAANTYQLTYFDGTNINTTTYGAYTAGGTGARVYEIATPYLEADLVDLHYTQSADVMTITHPSYDKRELKRLGAVNWTLSVIVAAPNVLPPVGGSFLNPGVVRLNLGQASGVVLNEYQATFINSSLEESLPTRLIALSDGFGITAITQANPGVITTGVAHGLVVDDPVFIGSVGGMPTLNEKFYRVNSVPAGNTLTLKNETTGVPIDTTAIGPYTAGGFVFLVGLKNDLTVAGNNNLISLFILAGAPPAGVIRFNVYKKLGGIYGFIGQATIDSKVKDQNILPDLTFTPPVANDPISTANNYPTAVGYWQGRRWFAGSNNAPQGVFATRSGTENNLTFRIPGLADDAIQVQLKARRADTIRHIIPGTDLLLLTSGGEWKINSSGQGPVTPSNISYTPEDYVGSSNVTPIVVGGSVLYSQDRGCRVRELNFVWQRQSYTSTDISVMAPHLFDTFTIKSMAYTRAPYSFAWAVRSDGVLLGLTYVPDQQVAAWFHRDTNGFFESVCSTPEGTEDVLYAIIRRVINGRTVRYFERQRTRQLSALASSFFVDAGSTYSGAPATNISGFYHLENIPITVLADGAVIPGLTVLNGSITLPQAASLVSGGLGYNCDLETLPLSYEAAALGQGVTKNVDEVMLRVHQSSSIKIGPSLTKLTDVNQRTTEPWGSPPNLVSGMLPVKINPSWNQDGGIAIRQSNPLPLTVLSMSLKVAVGG